MKTLRLYLKKISIFFMFLITLQSCVVYHSKIATVDEAIQSDDKVKVLTDSNDIYKLHKLKKEDGQIYGVVKKGSETAKRLSDQGLIKYSDSKYETILLTESTINEIHLKNKTLSTVLSIAVPVIGVAAIFAILINSMSNSMSFGASSLSGGN
ncbi:MAG: hypothetical protein GQ552_08015 [Flavobacteriaceae bacterium]|nr:hypothetical protein [Flavobacteriaceae bacterium]